MDVGLDMTKVVGLNMTTNVGRENNEYAFFSECPGFVWFSDDFIWFLYGFVGFYMILI